MKFPLFWLLTVMLMGFVFVTDNLAEVDKATLANKCAIRDGDIDLRSEKDEDDRRLQRINEAGFNVYMPAVWYGRDIRWPSKYAQWDSSVAARLNDRFDPPAYITTKAHEMVLEAHSWFTVALRWYPKSFPNIALPDVFDVKLGAFDVHIRAFRQFITSLIEEDGTNHDVDGINLDYIRAMGLCNLRNVNANTN